MSFELKEMSVNSTDNIHTLVGKIYIPEGEIKGLFHIVHGMTEHIGRYDPIMSKACENGYVVFAFDNLGHGKTARDDSELGYFSACDGWKYLVNDVVAFSNAVKSIYPDKPLYLFGHSMGSFIVRLVAESYGEMYEKLIVCGTGGKNPLAHVGLFITKLLKLFKGEKYISDFVIDIAFGAYNKRFDSDEKYSWLTKDAEIIKKYKNDKFCTFKFTVSGMHDLITLNNRCNRNAWYNKLPNDLPIFLISGDSDPVGNYSKGVIGVYKKLIKANKKATIKIYENSRHEILNDTCKDEVIRDILNFIK